jgi:hypothetical protein
MTPKYCFAVRVSRAAGSRRWQESKSFESLPAAVEFGANVRRRPDTKRVEILVVLDDWSAAEVCLDGKQRVWSE